LLFTDGNKEGWDVNELPITSTDFQSKKKHLDYFDQSTPSEKARSIIEFYDKDEYGGHEKSMSPARIFVMRLRTFYVTSEWKTNMDLHMKEVMELSDLADQKNWSLIQPAFVDEKKRPVFIK
jgi:hypothetical protein